MPVCKIHREIIVPGGLAYMPHLICLSGDDLIYKVGLAMSGGILHALFR